MVKVAFVTIDFTVNYFNTDNLPFRPATELMVQISKSSNIVNDLQWQWFSITASRAI